MAGNMRRRQCNSCKTSSSSSFISKDQKKKKKQKHLRAKQRNGEHRVRPTASKTYQSWGSLWLSLSHGTYSYIFYLLVCWAAFLSFLSNTCRDLSSHSNIHRVMILIGVDNEAGPRLRARWEVRRRGRSQLTRAEQVHVGNESEAAHDTRRFDFFLDGWEVSYCFTTFETSRPDSSVTWKGQPERSVRHTEQETRTDCRFISVSVWNC